MQRVEKYEVEEELGHGGMATVYRARDTHLDREVALKILHPHLRASSEARQRFAREAKSVARLKHPHILEVYDFSGADSEHSYIAAELLTGPTLKDFGAQHPELPAEVAVAMTLQISRALEAAHAHGIVHRDVKPENVMIHEGRTLKLTDFGIAQILDTQSFTATGQILGSPGHMAPEQVETGEVDERSDLFALGTVLYYLACGRLPFTGRNPHQILRRVMDAEYMDPLRVRPSIGAGLARIIARCLARSPADRYANAAELSAALVSWCHSVGLSDPDAAVIAYLQEPVETAAALTKSSVAQLIRTGTESIRTRDIPAAMDAFNRVLALDEGNAEALRQIETLGSVKRSPLPWVFAGAGALLIALAVGLSVQGAERGEADVSENPPADGPLAALDQGRSRADAATLAAGSREDAGLRAPTPPDVDGGAEAPGEPRDGRPNPRVTPRGPRQVVFQPSPANVEIAVDGGPLRPFGPSFRTVALTPGRHSFRVVGGAECCVERTFVSDVPPGEEPFDLPLRLAFRPASVYVVANTSADVAVAGGAGASAQGRTREILSVPMSRAEDTRRLTVTAEGHRVYTGVVRLRAGQLTEHRASLEPSPTVQESPPTPAPD
jgi:serine/threonine protein kinase